MNVYTLVTSSSMMTRSTAMTTPYTVHGYMGIPKSFAWRGRKEREDYKSEMKQGE